MKNARTLLLAFLAMFSLVLGVRCHQSDATSDDGEGEEMNHEGMDHGSHEASGHEGRDMPETEDLDEHDMSSMENHEAHEMRATAEPALAEASGEIIDLRNMYCPIQKGKTKADVYVDYEGFRVHFCCPGCDEEFLATPDEHLLALMDDEGLTPEVREKLNDYLEAN
ncbi:MAG: hypothetical protein NUW37_15555 [Planctomycetes bacterium]|nr:hypothetical protein [Planctomycetota bacterium]